MGWLGRQTSGQPNLPVQTKQIATPPGERTWSTPKNALYNQIAFGRYEKKYVGILSVSVDKKIEFIGAYRYQPIYKKTNRSYPGL